ncbi:hypothetical protein NXH64_10535 [Butyrivibrio fibrisolvens]|uniref:hypothetical protein n=1 Tax=Pseudobutyrivibrio ruminis TaxID=46206 RepID=UPI00041865E2|nr:hypothetical protein [Pseudobutyrivibrio ruminis]MDC7279934.1 hypothetical protein [Butyrivibrio fibrisolvens]
MIKNDFGVEDVIILVKELINSIYNKKTHGNIEVIVDNPTCYRIFLDYEKCIGEIIIEQSTFAPYRYISFNVLPSDTEDIAPIFYWNDAAGDSLEYIREKIEEGILLASNY